MSSHCQLLPRKPFGNSDIYWQKSIEIFASVFLFVEACCLQFVHQSSRDVTLYDCLTRTSDQRVCCRSLSWSGKGAQITHSLSFCTLDCITLSLAAPAAAAATAKKRVKKTQLRSHTHVSVCQELRLPVPLSYVVAAVVVIVVVSLSRRQHSE